MAHCSQEASLNVSADFLRLAPGRRQNEPPAAEAAAMNRAAVSQKALSPAAHD